MPSFIVFGLTRPGIEPRSFVSVADALPLICDAITNIYDEMVL